MADIIPINEISLYKPVVYKIISIIYVYYFCYFVNWNTFINQMASILKVQIKVIFKLYVFKSFIVWSAIDVVNLVRFWKVRDDGAIKMS